jgi:hypothetical protein
MKMKKKSSKRTAKRHVVLTERELSTVHAGKKAKKKATKSVLSDPSELEFGFGSGGGGNI